MVDLGLETLVFSLLSSVSFCDNVIENSDFFLKVALDVVALCVRNRFNCVLLTLELTDFFAGKGNLRL